MPKSVFTICFASTDSLITSRESPRPLTCQRPSVRRVMPAIARNVVVLPAPLGPNIPRIEPAKTSKVKFSTARVSPYHLW